MSVLSVQDPSAWEAEQWIKKKKKKRETRFLGEEATSFQIIVLEDDPQYCISKYQPK